MTLNWNAEKTPSLIAFKFSQYDAFEAFSLGNLFLSIL